MSLVDFPWCSNAVEVGYSREGFQHSLWRGLSYFLCNVLTGTMKARRTISRILMKFFRRKYLRKYKVKHQKPAGGQGQ